MKLNEINNEIFAVKNLSFRYSKKEIIKDLNFSVNKGETIGMIGANGNGKSTFFKCATGLNSTYTGEVVFYGKYNFNEVKDKIGVLFENFQLFENLTVVENIKAIAQLKKINNYNIKEILAEFYLEKFRDVQFGKLSYGNKQRLGLTCALLNDPDICFFDEPNNGIDPIGIKLFRDKLNELKVKGKTILLSSHILGELELTCSHIVFMNEGKFSNKYTIELIKKEHGNIENAFIYHQKNVK